MSERVEWWTGFDVEIMKELQRYNLGIIIDTKMNKNLTKEAIQTIVDNTPLSRIGTPKDVANLVEFLISEKANFITGQIITIDGGFTL